MSCEKPSDVFAQKKVTGCRFCPANIVDRVVAESDPVWAVEDRYPVSKGHHLIVPKRHTAEWFEMSPQEKRCADALIGRLRARLPESDSFIPGFNIGMNGGASAGRTVFYANIHPIVRRDGDTQAPAGGVRSVIPDRMSYLCTHSPAADNR